MPKVSADQLLVRRGLAESRDKARALIMAGLVYAGEIRVEKAGQLMDGESPLAVRETLPFVSRAGKKLEQALDAFAVEPAGLVAADVGSSTGGFTDCLLQRGAAKVYAVDVDTRQLDWRLRQDGRVVPVEKNARFLAPEDFPEPPSLIVMDVSFISILKILPALKKVLPGGGTLLALIKPQFEARRLQVGAKGIIRDPAVRREVLERVVRGAEESGFFLKGLVRCATRGQKGNIEFFARFSGQAETLSPEALQALFKEVDGDE